MDSRRDWTVLTRKVHVSRCLPGLDGDTQKKKKKAVAVDLEDVATPTDEPSSTANNLAAAAGGPKVDKMGNTIAEEAPAEACVPYLLHNRVSCLR